MEEERFDDLARLITTKTSRRQALKVLAGAAIGGLFVRSGGGLALAKSPNCPSYCNQVFGMDTAAVTQCIKDAKRGTGACYNCGPASPSGTQPTCCQTNASGYCSSYTTTPCCSTGQTCCSGTCTALPKLCVTDSQCQSGHCVEVFESSKNYCSSGIGSVSCEATRVCPAGQFCSDEGFCATASC